MAVYAFNFCEFKANLVQKVSSRLSRVRETETERDIHRHRQRKTQRHIDIQRQRQRKHIKWCRESSCIKRHSSEKLKITGWHLAGPVQLSKGGQGTPFQFLVVRPGYLEFQRSYRHLPMHHTNQDLVGGGEFGVYSIHLCLYIGKREFPHVIVIILFGRMYSSFYYYVPF